ncbi:MAG TPA: GDP-mannose 4,6-dehydratase [Steroidobacteraceae bacterium]|nr:GDP-mannose 4,6-dehydratase [Steroidobacteraceae bacterium]
MKTKTALIFGISGQDGAYLAHMLLAKGYRVHGTSRDAEAMRFGNLVRLGIRDQVQLHSASLADFRSTLSILTSVAPDEIYNLSGQSSVALSFNQPVETFESVTVGTLNILECIRYVRQPLRMFTAISSECFGDTPEPADEHSAFRPCSPYGMAKSAAFWAVKTYREAYGLKVCCGILSNHESPIRPTRFVLRKIVSAAVRIANGSNERLTLGNVSIRRDWGLAAEYADAMWRILQQDEVGDFVIATGETCTLADLLDAVFAYLGLNAVEHVTIDESLLRPLDVSVSRLNPQKAHDRLHWQARYKGRRLAELLVRCEREGSIGPLPWVPGS